MYTVAGGSKQLNDSESYSNIKDSGFKTPNGLKSGDLLLAYSFRRLANCLDKGYSILDNQNGYNKLPNW
jgi:hypothetical protein